MPAALALRGFISAYVSPPISICASSGEYSPARIFTSVDLPAPFSPSRARIEPPATSRSTPWRTSTPPNDLRTPRAVRVTALIAGVPASLLAGVRVDRLDVVRGDD